MTNFFLFVYLMSNGVHPQMVVTEFADYEACKVAESAIDDKLGYVVKAFCTPVRTVPGSTIEIIPLEEK